MTGKCRFGTRLDPTTARVALNTLDTLVGILGVKELANRLGLSTSSVQAYRARTAVPTLETWERARSLAVEQGAL